MVVGVRCSIDRWFGCNFHVLNMSYLKNPPDFYMIRTSKSHYYKGASGTSKATPKLYSKGQAEAWCKKFNLRQNHESDGPWEVVQVELRFGESYVPE